jgi:hypothetical protein
VLAGCTLASSQRDVRCLRSCRLDDLQECEKKAAGNWPAFLSLAGVAPSLARVLMPRPSTSSKVPRASGSGGAGQSALFAWAVLLTFLCAESTDQQARDPICCLSIVHAQRLWLGCMLATTPQVKRP